MGLQPDFGSLDWRSGVAQRREAMTYFRFPCPREQTVVVVSAVAEPRRRHWPESPRFEEVSTQSAEFRQFGEEGLSVPRHAGPADVPRSPQVQRQSGERTPWLACSYAGEILLRRRASRENFLVR